MGSDKAKLEKKRIKAQLKAEKARSKDGLTELSSEPQKAPSSKPAENKWYKDPNWVRAIIAIATLIVMVITLLIALQ